MKKPNIGSVVTFVGIVTASVLGTVFETVQMKHAVRTEVDNQLNNTSNEEES